MYDDNYDQCIAIKGAQRMWAQALVCLLEGLSHEKTAAKIGVSEETLTRWWDKGVKGRPQLSAAVEDIREARKAVKDNETIFGQAQAVTLYKEAIDKGLAAIKGTPCPKTWLMNLAKSGALDDIFKTMPGLASEDMAVRAGFVVDTNLYVVGVGGASVALFGVDFDGEKLRAAAGLSGPVFEGADEAGYEKAICDVLAHPLVARRIRAMLNGVTRIRHDLNGWLV